MSLNTAHANGGVLIFNGEFILLYCDGVEFTIEGSDAKSFGGTKKGRIYLTTHRMIFVNKSEKDALQSFSFPFFSMSKIDLEQPIFGANYIKGIVNAQNGGNWTGEANFKLKFFSGGAIEFGQAMLKAAKMASQYMPPQPPPYTPQQGPYYPAPPPSYMPPAGGVYGFVPPSHAFPDAPPANSVYMTEMPPPYPGIYPPPYSANPPNVVYPQAGGTQIAYAYAGSAAAPPPGPGFNVAAGPQVNGAAAYAPNNAGPGQQPPENPAYAKAYAAGFPIYRNPEGNDVFVPAPASNGYQQNYQEPPPPYSESSKKNQ